MSKSTLLTILGGVASALTAIIDFIIHYKMDAPVLSSPTFWGGIGLAVVLGLKGYLQQGTPPAGQEIVTVPIDPSKPL